MKGVDHGGDRKESVKIEHVMFSLLNSIHLSQKQLNWEVEKEYKH